MNPQESSELMDLIRTIRDRFDLTILLIEHDMKVVMGVCAHIWVLEYGLCIADGDPASIRGNQRVIEAYLGEEYIRNA
jgi:branched-chain amino acid transport system ATP-binding protein